MDTDPADPRQIDVLAVTAGDAVAALEARHQRGRRVVLRVTPPFSGRMRARIHDATGADADSVPTPVHVDPAVLFDDDAPPHPRPGDTADDLRADPDRAYDVDRHHEFHRDAVASWRERVREHVVDRATTTTTHGPSDVEVVVLD